MAPVSPCLLLLQLLLSSDDLPSLITKHSVAGWWKNSEKCSRTRGSSRLIGTVQVQCIGGAIGVQYLITSFTDATPRPGRAIAGYLCHAAIGGLTVSIPRTCFSP